MSATTDPARQRASREATEWLIVLREEPEDRALRQQFEAWRDASPLNASAWETTARVTDLAAAVAPVHADKWQPFLAQRQGEAPPQPRRTRDGLFDSLRRRWALATLVAVAAAAVAVAVVPAALLRLQADHLTSTAELESFALDDGSTVTLAAASAIAVTFKGSERQVRLIAGEAFFQVKPDPKRPFVVEADSVRTTVLGTSFDVRRDSDGVAVAVEEGIVQVASTASGTAERLTAGDTVRVGWNGHSQRAKEAPQLVAGWRNGQLLAQDRSLQDAVDQLRRYYEGAIVLTDASLGTRRITGVYNLADPEEALRGIARAHGAKVRRVTPWLLVVSAD
jgi:transmembrane sensor